VISTYCQVFYFVFFRDFVIWVRRCVVRRLCDLIWFRVLLQCSIGLYWMISFSQSQIQSMIWTPTLQIQKHEYSGYLDFIMLLVDTLSLYAINLDVVSLFTYLPFTFLAILIMLLYLMYSINLNEKNIVLFL